MNIKRYSNEILVAVSLLLLIAAYLYKNHQVTKQTQEVSSVKHSLVELKEVIALKKIWGDTKLGKKVDNLKRIMPASKVKWSKKQNKVTASYSGLNANELNKLITQILNTAVVIRLLDIQKVGESYNVEFKCEW